MLHTNSKVSMVLLYNEPESTPVWYRNFSFEIRKCSDVVCGWQFVLKVKEPFAVGTQRWWICRMRRPENDGWKWWRKKLYWWIMYIRVFTRSMWEHCCFSDRLTQALAKYNFTDLLLHRDTLDNKCFTCRLHGDSMIGIENYTHAGANRFVCKFTPCAH